jgi:DNA-binding NarL/FixJ family response regulator
MATILCAGGESLHTRGQVLNSAGFDVVTVRTEEELLAAGRLPDVAAVLLDSRSNISDLPAVATHLKRAHPRLRVVLVTDAGMEDVIEPVVGVDRIMSRLDGPAALLQTLRELTAGTTCSAATNYARTRELFRRVEKLKRQVSRLREKLRQK